MEKVTKEGNNEEKDDVVINENDEATKVTDTIEEKGAI